VFGQVSWIKKGAPNELPFNQPIYSTCFILQQERLRLALQGRLQDLPQYPKQDQDCSRLVLRRLQASSSVPLLELVRV
jgi:hypothetical protein